MIPTATAYLTDVAELRKRVCFWQAEAEGLREENIRMRHRIECLRGALKSAAGKFFEIGERGAGEDCMEWAGDMEPPLMGSNDALRGRASAACEGPLEGTVMRKEEEC